MRGRLAAAWPAVGGLTQSGRFRAADAPGIAAAADLLRRGRLVAFPTETVYGLGADATSDRAVAAVFAAKGRPASNPLIVHLADAAEARGLAHFDARADRLAAAYWPGPLTLVLRKGSPSPISPVATAGLDTLALRVPAHPVAQALLREVARPIAAPSANPSGRLSPTMAEHVAQDLGTGVDLVLDGGTCPVGVESSVVDLSRPDAAYLLRPGGIGPAALEAVLGAAFKFHEAMAGPARSPGLLTSHYAPRLPLRMDAREVRSDEALLAFGPHPLVGAGASLNLSEAGNLDEAARNLFAMLRQLDRSGAAGIAVMPIPDQGVGAAIRDRLQRAAAPRPP